MWGQVREERLFAGLLWILALDAFVWSENVILERLALVQVVGFCVLHAFWAAKCLLRPENAPALGLQRGRKSTQCGVETASAPNEEALAEQYKLILNTAINETINRQNMARMQRNIKEKDSVETSCARTA